MKAKEIVQWDIDEASYLGDGDHGVYYQVGEKRRGKDKGWYVTVCWEGPHDFHEFVTDDGPYATQDEAIEAGENYAYNWCIDNGVDWEEAVLDDIEQATGYLSPEDREKLKPFIDRR